jgi:predicted Zn finger-like uncharacterized protein
MILTCPECATSYFVDDARIPPKGRRVKCSSCGARWLATPDGATGLDEEAGGFEDDLAIEGPEATAPPAEDIDFVAPVTRARPAAAKPRRTGLFVGGAVAAVLIVALGAAIALREQVAMAVPGAGAVFAAVGLPVSDLGLVIEGVKSTPTFEAGRPVLMVTGAVRNVRDQPAKVPSIRISLLDRNGKPVFTKVVDPVDPKVVPGDARRYFAVGLPDPPSGARELEIGFEAGGKQTLPTTPIEHAAAAAKAAAVPEPAEAQGLPAGSPDALESHGPPHE